MNILVTGGAGFIGSHIVDILVGRGDHVAIIDDLSTGKKENLNPKAAFYHISITDPKIADVFKKEKPDSVVHLAAQADVTRSVKDPIYDATINILGGLNLLEQCRIHKVKKIVYSNSGGAGSGEPQYLPVDEDHPIMPLCPYGVSKHTLEHYLYIYSQLYGLKYTSLRYANVYGPRQDPFGEGGVVAIFSYRLLHGEVSKIFGDGEQTRDFVYVEDVAAANVFALDNPASDGGIFNVSTAEELSVNDLYAKMKKLCLSHVDAEHVEGRKGEIIRSVLANKKLVAAGWLPQVPLEEGLRRTIDFFRKAPHKGSGA